jgi:ATP/maltotriose-dependent transcriptional regulator MalT
MTGSGALTALTARAKVEAVHGEAEQAEKLAREAVEMVRGCDTLDRRGDALSCLAEILASQGRPEEAAALVREAIEAYERKGNAVSAG